MILTAGSPIRGHKTSLEQVTLTNFISISYTCIFVWIKGLYIGVPI